MKENYEALKMEVIAFDGDIFTARDDAVLASGDEDPVTYVA